MDKILFLPWPPTINSYYAHTRGNAMYISKVGRIFRENVGARVAEQLPGVQLSERLYVECVLHPPDKRVRDLDNYMKALLDAVTHSGLWIDDSQIDQLCLFRGVPVKTGIVKLSISDAGPIIPNVGNWPIE